MAECTESLLVLRIVWVAHGGHKDLHGLGKVWSHAGLNRGPYGY